MIVDDELDNIEMTKSTTQNELTTVQEQHVDTSTVNIHNEFSKNMDIVKENVLKEAAANDDTFVDTIKKNVKSAAVKLTEVEKAKATYQEQQVQFESEKLDTQQQKNLHTQQEDKWSNRQKRRQYHYDGVAPIMKFVNITEPMNLVCLYFLTIVLMIPFLIGKFLRGTFGTLIAGATDGSRSKLAKGFLWTIACAFALFILICLVYLFLKWQDVDILANIKS